MESVIKWRTGKPKESGSYLITTYNEKVFVDYWNIFPDKSCWEYRNNFAVKAWCPLSDIEPYKE